MKEEITICIAESQTIFRKGLRMILKKSPKMSLIGCASHGASLLHFVTEQKPNILLMDLNLPKTDCISIIKKIVADHKETNVIILSQSAEENLTVDLLKAGASGYILKDAEENEIFNAISEVYNGRHYYSGKIASRIIHLLEESRIRSTRRKVLFSEREEEIVKCICNELTNKEIAEKMFMSVRTVEGYRLQILRRIKAKSTAGIVIYAIKQGIYSIHR